jgi:hypothetical protein
LYKLEEYHKVAEDELEFLDLTKTYVGMLRAKQKLADEERRRWICGDQQATIIKGPVEVTL